MSFLRCLLLAVLIVGAIGSSSTPAPSPPAGTNPFCGLCDSSGSNYTVEVPGAIVNVEGLTPITCLSLYEEDQKGQINPGLCSLIRDSFGPCKCLVATKPSKAPSAAPVAPSSAPVAPTSPPSSASVPTSSPSSASVPTTSAPAPSVNASAPTSAPVSSPTGGSSPATGTSSGNSWFAGSLLLGMAVLVGTVAVL